MILAYAHISAASIIAFTWTGFAPFFLLGVLSAILATVAAHAYNQQTLRDAACEAIERELWTSD